MASCRRACLQKSNRASWSCGSREVCAARAADARTRQIGGGLTESDIRSHVRRSTSPPFMLFRVEEAVQAVAWRDDIKARDLSLAVDSAGLGIRGRRVFGLNQLELARSGPLEAVHIVLRVEPVSDDGSIVVYALGVGPARD